MAPKQQHVNFIFILINKEEKEMNIEREFVAFE